MKIKVKNFEEIEKLAKGVEEETGALLFENNIKYTKVVDDVFPKDRIIEVYKDLDDSYFYETVDHVFVIPQEIIDEILDETERSVKISDNLLRILLNIPEDVEVSEALVARETVKFNIEGKKYHMAAGLFQNFCKNYAVTKRVALVSYISMDYQGVCSIGFSDREWREYTETQAVALATEWVSRIEV